MEVVWEFSPRKSSFKINLLGREIPKDKCVQGQNPAANSGKKCLPIRTTASLTASAKNSTAGYETSPKIKSKIAISKDPDAPRKTKNNFLT